MQGCGAPGWPGRRPLWPAGPALSAVTTAAGAAALVLALVALSLAHALALAAAVLNMDC